MHPELKCDVSCSPGLIKAKQSVMTSHRRSTSFAGIFATAVPSSVETPTASFVPTTSAGVQRSSTKLAASSKYYIDKGKADFLANDLNMSTPGTQSSGMVTPTPARAWKTSKYNSTSLGYAAQKSGVGTFAPSSGSLIDQLVPHKRIG